MYTELNKKSLLFIGTTSLLSSRAMFFFINDPEGPNLLVVAGMALILYSLSLGIVRILAPLLRYHTHRSRLPLTIFAQLLLVVIFYFLNL